MWLLLLASDISKRVTEPVSLQICPLPRFNGVLPPASLLMDISFFQAIVERQPDGTAVLVLPSPTPPLRRVYTAVARVLGENGKNVKLYRAA